MTARGFRHVVTRSRVLVPIAVGTGLLLMGAEIAGFIVLGVGIFKAIRMLGYRDLDLRLELKGQKEPMTGGGILNRYTIWALHHPKG